jgi:hypothetical protein
MYYLDFLGELHRRLAPRTYLEIGIAGGRSLARSRCASIGIDPAFNLEHGLAGPVSLFRETSDDYFAALAKQRASPFEDLPIDLAFIDGMHLLEYVLRDFIAIERHSTASTVVAIDDVLPRDAAQASRSPNTFAWAGDVFRIAAVLAARRPELTQIMVDTDPTGTLLIAGLDPADRRLEIAYEDIVREHVVPDPQSVPREVLRRRGALGPRRALRRKLWDDLRDARPDADAHRGEAAS